MSHDSAKEQRLGGSYVPEVVPEKPPVGAPPEGWITVGDERVVVKMPTFVALLEYLAAAGKRVQAGTNVDSDTTYEILGLCVERSASWIKALPADQGTALFIACSTLFPRLEKILKDLANVTAQLSSSFNKDVHS